MLLRYIRYCQRNTFYEGGYEKINFKCNHASHVTKSEIYTATELGSRDSFWDLEYRS